MRKFKHKNFNQTEASWDQLERAVQTRDIAQFCSLLRKASDLEATDRNDTTAFLRICAIPKLKKEYYNLLMEAGANINAIDEEGRTPLFSGAYDGNLRALKFLCESGADLSIKDKKGITAHQYASDSKQVKAAALLKSYQY